jgi:hypothetical protein
VDAVGTYGRVVWVNVGFFSRWRGVVTTMATQAGKTQDRYSGHGYRLLFSARYFQFILG